MRKNKIVPGSTEATSQSTAAQAADDAKRASSAPAAEPTSEPSTEQDVELPAHLEATSPCCDRPVVVDPLLEANIKGICPSCALLLDFVDDKWELASRR